MKGAPSPLGCHISDMNFILGGLCGYSLGKYRWALKQPPSLRQGVKSVHTCTTQCRACSIVWLPHVYMTLYIHYQYSGAVFIKTSCSMDYEFHVCPYKEVLNAVQLYNVWMQYNISAIYVPQKHWLRLAHPLLPTQLEHYCSTFEYMCLNRQVMKTCWAEEKRFGNAYRHVFVTAACLSVPDLQSTSALEMSHRNACHYIMHYLVCKKRLFPPVTTVSQYTHNIVNCKHTTPQTEHNLYWEHCLSLCSIHAFLPATTVG